MNYYSKGVRIQNRYKLSKAIKLICLFLALSVVLVACKGSPDKPGTEDNSAVKPTELPTAEPTSTIQPEPTSDITPSIQPEPTSDITPSIKPKPTSIPLPTLKPDITIGPVKNLDFLPSKNAINSASAIVQGNYLFYKTGKLTKTVLTSENLVTSEAAVIATIEDPNHGSEEFYLKDYHIYYLEDGDIYQIGVDGKNKIRLYKGTARILGFHEEDVFALDRKTREIIRINKEGDKISLVKIKSIDTLEAAMTQEGLYYISKSSNNTLEGNDPIDRLFYIDFEGKNQAEVYSDLDIYDLKRREDELFFLSISNEPELMLVNKVANREVTTIHRSGKEELTTQGCNWFEANTFTLLAADETKVYYGVDFNNGKDMNVYSVGTNGENQGLYLNAYDIEGMHGSAYFMSGEMDGDYLKLIFDCDEDPAETYLIDLRDKSSIKFEGGYYIPGSIDVEGEYVYYNKSSEYDRYGELPYAYEYGRRRIASLK